MYWCFWGSCWDDSPYCCTNTVSQVHVCFSRSFCLPSTLWEKNLTPLVASVILNNSFYFDIVCWWSNFFMTFEVQHYSVTFMLFWFYCKLCKTDCFVLVFYEKATVREAFGLQKLSTVDSVIAITKSSNAIVNCHTFS